MLDVGTRQNLKKDTRTNNEVSKDHGEQYAQLKKTTAISSKN